MRIPVKDFELNNNKLNLFILFCIFLFSHGVFAQSKAMQSDEPAVQLGARPDDSSIDITEDMGPSYNAPNPEAPIRRREAGFVTDNMQGSASRGVNRGINRGVSRGVTRGVTRGINRGLSRGINRGANRGINRGANSGEEDLEFAELPKIIAPLAPQRTGFSSIAQPQLWWYLSDVWPGVIYFTLNEAKVSEPLLELELQPNHAVGMHHINLAEHNVILKENTEYEWFVYIIIDPWERSADFLASATLIYKPLTNAKQISFSSVVEKYTLYAELGYWYDAIALLSNYINEMPKQKSYRNHRASLIEQVNMPLVANFDK